jgi:protein translocase SecG subunit
MGFLFVLLAILFMVVITPSNEGGMAAAFGGMGGDSFFGSKANQHVNRFTVFLAVSFLVLAMALNFMSSGKSVEKGKGRLEQRLEEAKPPAPPAIPGTPETPPVPAPPK